MRGLRVLITTYHQAFLFKGGGEYELIEVADNLKKAGAIVNLYGPNSRSLDNYDVVLHFSVHGGGLELIEEVKRLNKPVVLWPNLWWDQGSSGSLDLIRRHVEVAERVVFKSRAERDLLCSMVDVPVDRIRTVPSGVDPCYARVAPLELFKTLYDLDEYVVWIGIVEESKNQLFAIEALRSFEIPVVFVGNFRERDYYDACRKSAPAHFRFIPVLPHKSEVQRSAMQGCRVYLEVPHEPPGTSAIEAGLSGRPMVLSDSAWSREHFGDHAVYVDPRSAASIREGVARALIMPHSQAQVEDLLKRHSLPDALEPLLAILTEVAGQR